MPVCLVEHWRKLTFEACADERWIHPEDRSIFRFFAGEDFRFSGKEKEEYKFNLDFPPPAYVGDVQNADVFLLLSSGGYNEGRTEGDFRNITKEEFLDHLHNPQPIDPGRIAFYWKNYPPEIVEKIREGRIAIVNACAYRAENITRERRNLCHLLPSVQLHRRWLFENILPDARSGKTLIYAHRWGLWLLDKELCEGPNIMFTEKSSVSPYLPREARAKILRWLDAHPSPSLR